jgi:hypothetical protein
MHDPVPDAAVTTPAPQPNGDAQDHYTAVVLIHGIGDIKRNTTLEEAVNTLTYWFNHEAGLRLRRAGKRRLWLTAQLTVDPNPDAPAARATMDLAQAESRQTHQTATQRSGWSFARCGGRSPSGYPPSEPRAVGRGSSSLSRRPTCSCLSVAAATRSSPHGRRHTEVTPH